MKNSKDLSKKLLQGETVTLSYNRYNNGSEDNPDIIIDHLFAEVENFEKYKDIVIKLSKEDDEIIFETYEVYRFPYITNLDVLETILKKVVEQSHI